MKRTNEQIAMTVSRNTIIVNAVLFVFKLVAGIMGHSAAMLSDAVHSVSDVFSTIIVIVGIKLANKEADKEHPYGHERFENVAAIILAGLLAATGFGIGYTGVQTILAGDYSSIVIPGKIALVAAVASIIIKEAMYWYTRNAAKKINSSALMADAWHHRSDAFSSIGGFIGIFGAQMGYPVMDSVASLVISFFIIKVSVDIFRDAISKMIDRAADDEIEKQIVNIALEHEDVISVAKLKTRVFGDKIYVDLYIRVDGNLPLYASYDIGGDIHDAIEKEIPNVKHCFVHVKPDSQESNELSL